MFPVVNSRWRVMEVIPCCSPDPHFAILHPAMPQEAGPSAQILGLLAPTGFIQLGQGQRWEGGKGGSHGIYSSTPSLSAEIQAPIRKPSLSGSGNRSPPCVFKMLRFPESLGYSTISCGFPIPCSLLCHIFPVRTPLDTKV